MVKVISNSTHGFLSVVKTFGMTILYRVQFDLDLGVKVKSDITVRFTTKGFLFTFNTFGVAILP